MKPILLLLAGALLLTAPAIAQNQVAKSEIPQMKDTTIIVNKDQNKVTIIEKGATKIDGGVVTITNTEVYLNNRKKRHGQISAAIDLGFNTYNSKNIFTGSDSGENFLNLNTSKSINFAWYITTNFKLSKNRRWSLDTGIGFDWNNYRFENGWTIANIDGMTVPSNKYREAGESRVSKSKLTSVYLNVPLMVRFEIPTKTYDTDKGKFYKNNIYLSAGVIGGLKLGSHTKAKYYNGGGKVKDSDSFNLNLCTYDLSFRAGYKCIGIYFNYQMTPLFESGKGPKLYPYSVGVSFGW